MASGRDERALSRPSIPLADHSTSKPRSASSAVISSAVSLSSSIRSTFVIGSFPAAAKAFAPRAVLEAEFCGIICLLETKCIISTARERHGKDQDIAARLSRGVEGEAEGVLFLAGLIFSPLQRPGRGDKKKKIVSRAGPP